MCVRCKDMLRTIKKCLKMLKNEVKHAEKEQQQNLIKIAF